MKVGREVTLFNGEGGEYTAFITHIDKKATTLEIKAGDDVDRESPLEVELCIGISRGERMDWVLQKATELGVSKITPVFTERTEVKLNAQRLEKKMSHWRQIIISACEQCQRNRLPLVNPPQNLSEYLPQCSSDMKLVLHHRSDEKLSEREKPESLTLLVGPEGGLSESEIQTAEKNGFSPLTLGPRVLRTETAPLVALSLCQYRWGDLF